MPVAPSLRARGQHLVASRSAPQGPTPPSSRAGPQAGPGAAGRTGRSGGIADEAAAATRSEVAGGSGGHLDPSPLPRRDHARSGRSGWRTARASPARRPRPPSRRRFVPGRHVAGAWGLREYEPSASAAVHSGHGVVLLGGGGAGVVEADHHRHRHALVGRGDVLQVRPGDAVDVDGLHRRLTARRRRHAGRVGATRARGLGWWASPPWSTTPAQTRSAEPHLRAPQR